MSITTAMAPVHSLRGMSADITTIHRNRQPSRPHHIPEWAAARRLSQADLARELDADKSVVSRWYSGATPSKEYQDKLAALFGTDPESLFRHPDDDWLAKFFRDRSRDEIERIKATLETAFPRRRA